MEINAEVTPEAKAYLLNLLEKQNVPGMAARVFLDNGGTSKAETCLAYCPPGEEKTSDTRTEYGDLTLYFDALSVPYLQDMKIDVDRHGSGQMLAIYRKSAGVSSGRGQQKTFG